MNGSSSSPRSRQALSEAEGVDPVDLCFALEDHVDTDALSGLTSHDSASWSISFEVPDHRVTVTGVG